MQSCFLCTGLLHDSHQCCKNPCYFIIVYRRYVYISIYISSSDFGNPLCHKSRLDWAAWYPGQIRKAIPSGQFPLYKFTLIHATKTAKSQEKCVPKRTPQTNGKSSQINRDWRTRDKVTTFTPESSAKNLT